MLARPDARRAAGTMPQMQMHASPGTTDWCPGLRCGRDAAPRLQQLHHRGQYRGVRVQVGGHRRMLLARCCPKVSLWNSQSPDDDQNIFVKVPTRTSSVSVTLLVHSLNLKQLIQSCWSSAGKAHVLTLQAAVIFTSPSTHSRTG